MSEGDKFLALRRLKEAVRNCSPTGSSTLLIQWVGGRPTASGRTDYYDLRVMDVVGGRPKIGAWLSYNYCAAGYARFNGSRECISLGGCGYNKAHQIARTIALAAGHLVACDGVWVGVAGEPSMEVKNV